jgi:hypothetical protein
LPSRAPSLEIGISLADCNPATAANCGNAIREYLAVVEEQLEGAEVREIEVTT